MSLSSKIAIRYLLREAGTFNAPPKFLKKITEFFTEKYAGHILARTNRRLEAFRSEDAVDFRKAKDELQADYRDIARDWLSDAMMKTLENGGIETRDLVLNPATKKGLRLISEEGELYYTYTQDGRKKGRLFGPYRSWEMGDKLYDIVNKSFREMNKLERKTKKLDQNDDAALVELVRLQKACEKLAKKPREYKTTARFTTAVDVSGWRYVDDAKAAQKRLDAIWGDNITVLLYFQGHVRRGGVWKPTDLELQVDMSNDARTVDEFERNLERIRSVAEHEAQHVGQDALKIIKRLKEDAGLPSPANRDDRFDPLGYDAKYRRRRDHALQDVEFHTRLRDEIDRAVINLKKVQKSDRRNLLRIWVDDSPLSSTEVRELSAKYSLSIGVPTRPLEFFKALKNTKGQEAKWREAMRDYISEVSSKVSM